MIERKGFFSRLKEKLQGPAADRDQASGEELLKTGSAPSQALASEQSAASDEKASRRYPRVTMEIAVDMSTDNNFYTGLTENISEGGVFIATRDPIPLGTEVKVKIQLPQHDPFELEGEVCWLREYNEFTDEMAPGIGVAFASLAAETRTAIENFIRERDPLLYA